MSLQKKKRIEDKALLQKYREMKCLVCSHTPCDPHHIKSVGAGGDDVHSNLVPLCRFHHNEYHSIGHNTFICKYHIRSEKLTLRE